MNFALDKPKKGLISLPKILFGIKKTDYLCKNINLALDKPQKGLISLPKILFGIK